jgi:UDP-glucose 4-epimerase
MTPASGFAGARVLVTGGAGFIGSHIADAVLAQGASVVVLDDLSGGHLGNVDSRVELITADVCDTRSVQAAVEGADYVFHQAAQINPVRAVEDPLGDCRTNVLGSVVLLEAARKAKVRRVVLASTNLYGDRSVPARGITEATALLVESRSMLSPYAAAKAALEAYAKVYHDELGVSTVRLRYTNVYGPRQTSKAGSGVVALFVERAASGLPLEVFGAGTQTRDFIAVEDVVAANLAAALSPEASGQVFNIGTGRETSVLELAALVQRLSGDTCPVRHGRTRAADFARVGISVESAARVLGWRAEVALPLGLGATLAWRRARLESERASAPAALSAAS